MSIWDFIAKTRRRYNDQGFTPTLRSVTREVTGKVAVRPALRVQQARQRSQLAHQGSALRQLQDDDEWLLLVFDAGRFDYMAPLLDHQFETTTTRQYSAARDTFEWISTQWVDGVDDVTYVTAMVPIASDCPEFDADGFDELYYTDAFTDAMHEIVPVWKTHWDTGIAQVTPEDVVDVAMEYMNRKKLVVHFSQPHSPFIGMPRLLGHTAGRSATPRGGEPNDRPIWDRVQSGEVSDHYLRMAYQGNAARAVQAATPLVDAWDGRVVATADHGEALGEWGVYTHDRAPHTKRRVVPWAEINSVRKPPEGAIESVDRNEQLEALGYR